MKSAEVAVPVPLMLTVLVAVTVPVQVSSPGPYRLNGTVPVVGRNAPVSAAVSWILSPGTPPSVARVEIVGLFLVTVTASLVPLQTLAVAALLASPL